MKPETESMKRRNSGVSGRNCRDYQPPPKVEYRLTELGENAPNHRCACRLLQFENNFKQ